MNIYILFTQKKDTERGCPFVLETHREHEMPRERGVKPPPKIICFLLAGGLKDSIPYDNSCEELFFALLKSSFSLCSKK